jgi:hypothetical protein
MLELRQHEELRRQQGMNSLDDSERAQCRANCSRASSARIATVMAKATFMRLTGAPSNPAVAPVSRQHLTHNNADVSDIRDLRQAPSHSIPSSPPS